MTRDRFQRVKQLVQQALDLPEPERPPFLDRECEGDAELRAEVEALLEQPTAGLDDATVDVTTMMQGGPDRDTGPGREIGPYRLLEKIGEGGMGEVWVAEQAEPVKRRVALKVIKRGMDSDQIVARFEAERQALALMDHPSIAKVFDGGQTPGGRPYFVMEHVDGVPITEHCDRHKLSTKARLELFSKVCEGVQHAHQKAVIHRDIKPSNVLVTIRDDKALPKIIDFGVAKATSQRLTEKTVYTELGVLIGTPEYMSPEQAEMTGQSVDTRTDVYSLGVLLYELLTGALPFDSRELRAAGFDEIRRRIREVDPPKPSTRLGSLPGDRSTLAAQNRRSEPNTLTRQIRGDLDWITMKALEKDRTRRYGSASDLAMDLGRYLRDEPVLAGPPSGIYRAKKFVKRNKVGVGVAALLAVILIAFSVTTTIQSRRIAREAETAEQVSEFLVELFEVSDPSESRGKEITAREILDRGGEKIETELASQPEVRARMEHTFGKVYRGLGLQESAQSFLERAYAERRRLLGEAALPTLDSMEELGWLRHGQSRWKESAELLRPVVEQRRKALGAKHPDTLRSQSRLACIDIHEGRYDEATRLARETLEDLRETLGDEHKLTLSTWARLANTRRAAGYFEEALDLNLELLRIRTRVHGEDDPDTLAIEGEVALCYNSLGRHEEAERTQRSTLERQERVLGTDHPGTLISRGNLVNTLFFQKRYAEAEELQREILEVRRRVLEEDDDHTLGSMNNLAELLLVQGEFDESAALRRHVLEARRRRLGASTPKTLFAMGALATVEHRAGRTGEAEALYREALSLSRDAHGNRHPSTLRALDQLAWFLWKTDRPDQAEPFYREVLELREELYGPDDRETARIRRNFERLRGNLAEQGS